jgi:hypothetical protein
MVFVTIPYFLAEIPWKCLGCFTQRRKGEEDAKDNFPEPDVEE